MRVGVIARMDVEAALSLARQAVELLKQRGVDCLIEEGVAAKLGLKGVRVEDMEVDAVLSIGGDGTILRSLKRLRHPAPILGIKLGKVCFLGEAEPEEVEEVVEKLAAAKFFVEEVMKLRAELQGGVEVDAVNEVAVVTNRPAKTMELKVAVGEVEVFSGLADGVIVATPTGSTGYAMSAHGPVVDPSLEAHLIVLLSPLNLSYRPLVASASREVEVRVEGPEAAVVVDGEAVGKVGEGGWVRVRRSPFKAKFIRLSQDRANFFRRLKGLFEARTMVRKA